MPSSRRFYKAQGQLYARSCINFIRNVPIESADLSSLKDNAPTKLSILIIEMESFEREKRRKFETPSLFRKSSNFCRIFRPEEHKGNIPKFQLNNRKRGNNEFYLENFSVFSYTVHVQQRCSPVISSRQGTRSRLTCPRRVADGLINSGVRTWVSS